MRPTLAKFAQEFVWRHKERILLEYAADNDHGMGPHDVNHRIAAELAKMVGADYCVVVATPHVIHP